MNNAPDLIKAIGYEPGDDAFRVTSGNAEFVRRWIALQGIAEERVAKMREPTLYKAYAKPAYLRAILTRGDYNPNAAKTPIPASQHVREGGWICSQCEFDANPLTAPHCIACGASRYSEPAGTIPFPLPTENKPLPYIVVNEPPAAANGHDKGAQLAALIASMAGEAINEQRVIELIREHAPKPDDRVIERIVIQRDAEKIPLPDMPRHREFPRVLAAVMANIPVMLVGPAGAGKTTLGHQIADGLGLAFAHTGAVSSRYELSGFENAHGNYQPTAFYNAYKDGGLFLFDEIDGSDPAALLWCNTAIANGVCAFPCGNVERHQDFRLIAAANTYGKGADRVYVGRNALDGASLDRFVVIDFDYDDILERTVFGDNTWTQRVQSVRAAIATLKLRHVVSPRATDYGRRLLATGMPQSDVERIVLWKGMQSDDVAKIEREAL